MKTAPDLAQRLSDACVKTMLAVLALSALAFGLADRFHQAALFEPYYRFLSARATLDSLLANLDGDKCWQSYVQTLTEPGLAGQTTLGELKRIECTVHHDKMRINSSRSAEPGKIAPGSLQFMLPTKDASASQGWYQLGAAEILENTLVPLWDCSHCLI